MGSGNREGAASATLSSSEMLERCDSWSLACDNALLNRLKAFSENITKNSQELSKEFDTVSRDISALNYRLLNSTNEFLMLSNTQFVENRVEEFEEFGASFSSSGTTASVIKTKAEKEAELISKMKQAIQLCLTACNIKDKQKEKGTSGRFATLRPYLIGSPKFFSSKYCGLVDESVRPMPLYEDDDDFPKNDFMTKPNISKESASHSQQPGMDSENQESRPVGPSISSNSNQVLFTMPPPSNYSVSLSSESKNPSNMNTVDNFGTTPSPSLSDGSSDKRKSVASSSIRESIPQSVTDELKKVHPYFSPPPTVEDDSDDDFRPNASANRLFADEDDDDDIFGENDLFPSSRKPASFFGQQNQNPSSNIIAPVFTVPPPVNVSSVSVPHSNSNTASTHPPNSFSYKQEKVVASVSSGSMPKCEESHSNDIPSVKSAFPIPPHLSKKETEKPITSNDPKSEQSPKESIPAPTIQTRLPAGAVSVFGNLPPPTFQDGKLQQPSTTKTNISAQGSVSVQPTQTPPTVPSKHGTNKKQVPSSSSANSRIGQDHVRSDIVKKEPGIVSRLSKKVPTSSLFADDSSEDDLFASSSGKSLSAPSKSKQSSETKKLFEEPASSSTSNSQVNKANLFATEAPPAPAYFIEPQLIPKGKNISSSYKPVKKSIFDESDSDDDLFSSKSFSKPPAKKTPSQVKASSSISDEFSKSVFPEKSESLSKKVNLPIRGGKTSSLFGDDSDSDTDLFGNKKSKPYLKKTESLKAASSSSKSLTQTAPVQDKDKQNFPQTSKMGDVATKSLGDQTDHHLSSNLLDATFEPHADIETEVENNNQTKEPRDDNDTETTENVTVIVKIQPKSPNITGSDPVTPPEEKKEKLIPPPSKIKKSIFDDSESDDDDIFKSQSVTIKLPKGPVDKSKDLESTSKESDDDDEPPAAPEKDVKTSKERKRISLFEDSDSDSELFSKKKTIPNSKDSSVKTASKETTPSAPAPTPTTRESKDEEESKAPDPSEKEKVNDDKQKVDSDKPSSATTKPVGSKISEKIKAMQAEKEADKEENKTSKPKVKSGKVSVKSLALNLNINPLALKVGAKPPKPGAGSASNTPTPTSDTDPLSPIIKANIASEEGKNQEEEKPISEGLEEKLKSKNLFDEEENEEKSSKDMEETEEQNSVSERLANLKEKLRARKLLEEEGENNVSSEIETTTDDVKSVTERLANLKEKLKARKLLEEEDKDNVSSKEEEKSVTERLANLKEKLKARNLLEETSDIVSKVETPEEEKHSVPGGDVEEEETSTPNPSIPNDGEDHFVDIIKARAKIQRKRRPPSRVFLKSLVKSTPEEEETEECENQTEKVLKTSEEPVN